MCRVKKGYGLRDMEVREDGRVRRAGVVNGVGVESESARCSGKEYESSPCLGPEKVHKTRKWRAIAHLPFEAQLRSRENGLQCGTQAATTKNGECVLDLVKAKQLQLRFERGKTRTTQAEQR
jgi:hypothetical protein